MSYTCIYAVRADTGQAEEIQKYGNSWGGFARIWDAIYDYYLKDHSKPYDSWSSLFNKDNSKRLWALYTDEKVPKWIRIVLTSTFDLAMVEREKLNIYADYLDKFVEEFPVDGVCHLTEWAKECRKLYENEDYVGVCYYGTSCGENVWMSQYCEVTPEEFEEKFGFKPKEDDSRCYDGTFGEGYDQGYYEGSCREDEERTIHVWKPYNINDGNKHLLVFKELEN